MRGFSLKIFFLSFFLLILFGLNTLKAELFFLKDGSEVSGKLLSYEPQGFTLQTPQGAKRFLTREDVLRIEAQGPAASPSTSPTTPLSVADLSKLPPDLAEPIPKKPFETPLQTFWTWRKAAISDDTKGLLACYSKGNQKEVGKELKKISKSKRREMQEAAIQTYFFPNDPFYQGPRASLEVTWQKGLASDIQILQFILEGEEWKIVQ